MHLSVGKNGFANLFKLGNSHLTLRQQPGTIINTVLRDHSEFDETQWSRTPKCYTIGNGRIAGRAAVRHSR
eukprot:841043-Amphidinium_carterae.1